MSLSAGSVDRAARREPRARLLGVVASGDRRYREYLLASLAARYRVWLFDAIDPTWQCPYLEGFTRTDPRDGGALVAAARAVSRAAGPIDGLLSYDEWSVLATAEAAETLGLPGSAPEAVGACRDKARTRAALVSAGVPQPHSVSVTDAEHAQRVARDIGFPVVVKARSLAGSIGVVRADGPDRVADAFAVAAAPTVPGATGTGATVLVEQYLDGPEISIDCAVRAGRCIPLIVARKQLGPHPFFEETGHRVRAAEPLLHDPDLRRHLQHIHAALGLTDGMTHAEFRLTTAGPRLVEINARLGGDLIPHLGRLATGLDLAHIAADIAVGLSVAPRSTRSCVAGIRFLYPPTSCTVDSITTVPGTHPAVVDLLATARPGQTLALPPAGYLSRYGYIIAAADTLDVVEAALATGESAIALGFTPTAH